MSDDLHEYVAEHTGTSRRTFLTRLLVGSAFVVPVVSSFTMGGASAVGIPGGGGSNTTNPANPACAKVPVGTRGSNVVCSLPDPRP